ncbi:hypothetical protein CAL7716_101850 (plasmid) [Calothrix sp. PCC 7716]|nr:hypothetical protein CAL7716_101850 [Calothrix sp. PCC 7716]
MQLFFAEFCGRWGCTWQEGLLTLLLMTLFKTGLVGIIFILALPLLVVGSVVLGIAWIYEIIVDFLSPLQEKKQKELEDHIEAKNVKSTINSINRFVKGRQNYKNENSSSQMEEPKISSEVKPLGAIFNRAVQSINKNKASQ